MNDLSTREREVRAAFEQARREAVQARLALRHAWEMLVNTHVGEPYVGVLDALLDADGQALRCEMWLAHAAAGKTLSAEMDAEMRRTPPIERETSTREEVLRAAVERLAVRVAQNMLNREKAAAADRSPT